MVCDGGAMRGVFNTKLAVKSNRPPPHTHTQDPRLRSASSCGFIQGFNSIENIVALVLHHVVLWPQGSPP